MEELVLSSVVINWNRVHLLKTTLASYLATISVPYELTIIDNGSNDGSRELIEDVVRRESRVKAVCLDRNMGGEGINLGFDAPKGRFLHVSENDLEYFPGWDQNLLHKFEVFAELGQLSPFRGHRGAGEDELWETHGSEPVTREGTTIHLPDMNITTSCIYRRELWDVGLRWSSLPKEPGSTFEFPDDLAASMYVKDAGFWVAWNDEAVAGNWGFRVEEWESNLSYYLQDYESKPFLGRDGMREILLAHGYDLVGEAGHESLVRLKPRS